MVKKKWSTRRFLERAIEIHGYNYCYGEIMTEYLNKCTSRIYITCRRCFYRWSSSILEHINKKIGCPICSGSLLYPLDVFLIISTNIHGNKYDYSRVRQKQLKSEDTKITIICKTCHFQWRPKIKCFLRARRGCPQCRMSDGEKECQRILEEFGYNYIREYSLEGLSHGRYDFAFYKEEVLYLLEYDGVQHFNEIPYMHKSNAGFLKSQEGDFLKTKAALEGKAKMIRIDYTQISNIHYHLKQAVKEGNNLYLSTPAMYVYITNRL